ncbi:MAG: DUF5074 domain-containing protein [Flavobacteriaceae bacterium]
MKTIKKLALLTFGITLFFTSCSSDDNSSGGNVSGEYSSGILILNEGKFMSANTADVSFLSVNGTLENDIFYGVNNSHLGDTAQSIGIESDRAYIVINNSNAIKVVNRHSFELVTTITTDIQSPRYIVFENGKGYVSNLGNPADTTDDYIAVIDLNSNQVTATIPVAEGPEKMVSKSGKLYVAHKGGWGVGNSVSVINLSSNTVTAAIPVSDVPDGIEEENGYLYVLCSGFSSWNPDVPSSQGGLYKIDMNNNEIVSSLSFSEGVYPSHLKIENNKIYYTIGGNVYAMDLSATSLPIDAVVSLSEVYNIYGFEVEDGKIYISDPKDYNSNGEIFIYSTSGNLINSYEVGIAPNGFYFND